MLKYFFANEINKIGFEDILYIIKNSNNHYNSDKYLLINTLPVTEQKYLIKNTVSFELEEKLINDSLTQYSQYTIVIYGKNCSDKTIEFKYKQLKRLGYPEKNLFIYYGGLFEWSLLKDVYGNNFETTSDEKDILKFRPKSIFS